MNRYILTILSTFFFLSLNAQKPFFLKRWGCSSMHFTYFSPIETQKGFKMLPGIKVGAEFPIEYHKNMKQSKKKQEFKFSAFQISWLGNLGSYHYFTDHHAVFLNGEVALRYINVIIMEARIGLGLMKRFYVKDVPFGFNKTIGLMPISSFGFGYNFPHKKKIPLGIYLHGSIFDLLGGQHHAYPAISLGVDYKLIPVR